jgi:hypothetical protein
MVIGLLSLPGNPVNEIDALQETLKLECPQNRPGTLRPVGDGF